LDFDLRAEDLTMPTYCPLLGYELVYQADGVRVAASASLDRINSSIGYVADNCWIISWRANQIKSDATVDELRLIADGLYRAGRLLDGVTHDGFPA
jgi:hypothetical protein